MIPAERAVTYTPRTDPIPAPVERAAAITACEHAADATEARALLRMLGLYPGQVTS